MSTNIKLTSGRAYTVVGVAASAIWLLLFGAFAVYRWPQVIGMAPNEVGDFLAGAFAPLAFLWLVLGFFQQGQELRHSGHALSLQSDELRHSVEQQRQLVDVTREQLLFESSRLQREADRARALAQPNLQLRIDGWSSTDNGSRRQHFTIINHGRECTKLKLCFDNDWNGTSSDLLDRGGTHSFAEMMPKNPSLVQASATFLDAHQEPGEAFFEISFSGTSFSSRSIGASPPEPALG